MTKYQAGTYLRSKRTGNIFRIISATDQKVVVQTPTGETDDYSVAALDLLIRTHSITVKRNR